MGFKDGLFQEAQLINFQWIRTVADPGGRRGGHLAPPGPVKIGHKKDGHRRRPHRFHVSCPPLPGRWIRYCRTWTENDPENTSEMD